MTNDDSRAGADPGKLGTVREVWIVVALCGGWFLVGTNLTLVPPLLPFISQDLDVSSAGQGILIAALGLGSFLGNVLFGPLIDAVGPRRAFVTGALCAGLAMVATASSSSEPVIISLRVITGLLMPLVGVSLFSCVAEYIRPSRRVTVIGYVTAAGSVANLSTAPAVVLIAGLGSWRWAVLAVAALAILIGIAGLVAMPRSAPIRTEELRLSLLTPPKSPEVRAWVAMFFLFTLAQLTITSMYPTWLLANLTAAGMGIDSVSLLFLASGAVMVLAAALSGPISRRTGPSLFLGLFSVPVVAALVLPAVHDIYGAQVGLYAVLAAAQALAFPLIRASANQLADGELSRTNASLNAGFQIASTIAGLVGASLYSVAPSFWMNAGAGAVLFSSAFAVLLGTQFRRTARPRGQPTSLTATTTEQPHRPREDGRSTCGGEHDDTPDQFR